MQPRQQGFESLNSSCFCISLDVDELKRELEANAELRGLQLPNMFAAMPVFVSRHHLDSMEGIIRAVEMVIAQPEYKKIVLQWAPPVAHTLVNDARGVFLGYDFHVGEGGPKLIEINTNAGGALLNGVLARAQRACCPAIAGMATGPIALEELEQTFIAMFQREWRLARNEQNLRRIAVIDENPEGQYLYPEFILFKQLFRRHGIEAVVAEPAEFQLYDNLLWHGTDRVDLVYNRLTDFMLEHPAHGVLRQAYLSNAVVLTPNPRVHALYANKRNLAVLSDLDCLESLGLSEETTRTLLSGIPRTKIVNNSNAERLWSERRKLFFKPAAGFGSRAAYRGDKLTKRVWEQILAGDYVAQALVPPSDRAIARDPAPRALKFDVRNYVYDGAVQFIMARLYQGQTTNFRTPGGGFAPVFTEGASSTERTSAHCDTSVMSN